MLRGSVSTLIQAAVRGAFATRTQKTTFGQKLGAPTKGVATVGLNATGAVIPGGSVISNAIGSALGGVFAEIDEGVAEAERQIKSSPELAQQNQILADIAALRHQLRSIKTKLDNRR